MAAKKVESSRFVVFVAWHLWNIAAEAAERAKAIKKEDPRSCTADTLVAVMMSVAAAEAFINELAYTLDGIGRFDLGEDLQHVASIGQLLRSLEQDRAQILTKYSLAGHLLPQPSFDWGREPCQSFRRLVWLRNGLTHPKPDKKVPTDFDWFVSKKMTYQPDDGVPLVGWVFQVQTPEVACWACRTVAEMLASVVKRLRDLKVGLIDVIVVDQRMAWEEAAEDPRVAG